MLTLIDMLTEITAKQNFHNLGVPLSLILSKTGRIFCLIRSECHHTQWVSKFAERNHLLKSEFLLKFTSQNCQLNMGTING